MKMYLKILIVTFILFCLTTCKKYDEGGLQFRTVIKLFGGNKTGSSKKWYLKKYIVDGVDSTNQIKGYASDPPIIFRIENKESGITFSIKNSIYLHVCGLSYQYFAFGSIPTTKDTFQCDGLNCQRNIFMPLLKAQNYFWDIKKLTYKELILESNFISNHKYRIILKH
ncbi:MAG: hypothetical protein U0V03_03140 [Bacteroidia bacterium]